MQEFWVKLMESENVTAKDVAPAEDGVVLSELREKIWSVISFDKCHVSGLSYDDAVDEMKRLQDQKVSGLCIITDEAASRLKS